ncbi:hypothetical protein J9317_17945 [Metabacillus sp. KIGAM252]|uniref:Uncharacterized protein n=1 Tax=Metabacillus flavus TaxID=2823519 RepID=A0ABS5LIP2_9BACI|nr:hypothetical protein [Metabacillus flavus]MBS2970630.1 hypothetical protein [Metabacillus flavus]
MSDEIVRQTGGTGVYQTELSDKRSPTYLIQENQSLHVSKIGKILKHVVY